MFTVLPADLFTTLHLVPSPELRTDCPARYGAAQERTDGVAAGAREVALTLRDSGTAHKFRQTSARRPFNRYFRFRTEHRLKLQPWYLAYFHTRSSPG